jgi:hypothetical protein
MPSSSLEIGNASAAGANVANAARANIVSEGNERTLKLTANNQGTNGSYTVSMLMQGYENRGNGIFMTDTGTSGMEWFTGLPYQHNGRYYQIGADDGGLAEYRTSASIQIDYTDKWVGIGNGVTGYDLFVFNGNISGSMTSTGSFGAINMPSTARIGFGTTTPSQAIDLRDGRIIMNNNYGYVQRDAAGNQATLLNLNGSDQLIVGDANHSDENVYKSYNSRHYFQGSSDTPEVGWRESNNTLRAYAKYDSGFVIDSDSTFTIRANNTSGAQIKLQNSTTLGTQFTGNVGIGTAMPSASLHIYASDGLVGATPDTDGDDFIIESNADTGMSIISGEASGETGAIIFGTANDVVGAHIQYNYDEARLKIGTAKSSHTLQFSTDNNTTAMVIDAAGRVGIGTTSPAGNAPSLHLSGSGNDNMLLVGDNPHTTTDDRIGWSLGTHINGNIYYDHKVNTGGTIDFRYGEGTEQGYAGGTFMRVDATEGEIQFFDDIHIAADSKKMFFGAGDDLQFYHDGSNSHLQNGTGNFYMNNVASANLFFNTNNTTRMAITNTGEVLISGNDVDIASVNGTGTLQVLGTGNSDTTMTIGRFSANASPPALNFVKSRHGTIGSNTIIQDDDSCGDIVWCVSDGSDLLSYVAKIEAEVDGTPGANDVPGRLTFYTTADGANGSVERMRIDSSGRVGIGEVAPTSKLQVQYTTTSNGSAAIAEFGESGTGAIANSGHQVIIGGPSVGGYTGALIYSDTTTGYGQISFADGRGANDSWRGVILYKHSDEYMSFWTNAAEKVRIESDGDLHADGDVIAASTTISDKRLKDNVEIIPNALDKIKELRGVSFDWNKGSRKGQRDLGLIAQEVEKVLPELVREKKMPLIDDKEYLTVDYDKMVAVLVEAIKEQQVQIDELKTKLGDK